MNYTETIKPYDELKNICLNNAHNSAEGLSSCFACVELLLKDKAMKY